MTKNLGAPKLEEVEADLLLEGVYRYFGDDFRGYARAPLTRKLQALLGDMGLATMSALQDRVLHDDMARAKLLRALSHRPFCLFQDPAHSLALRAVLDGLLNSYATPRVWIAECASAEEVFTLTILLAEQGMHDRTMVFATAAHEGLLQEASQGRFNLACLPACEENYRRSGGTGSLADYFHASGDGHGEFSSALRSNITWAQYNLATDTSFNEFQLISCCGAFSDFGPALRRRVLGLFGASLAGFGVLDVPAADELAYAPYTLHFQAICREQGLYRRTS